MHSMVGQPKTGIPMFELVLDLLRACRGRGLLP